MVTGELAFAVRHEGGLMRLKRQHKIHQIVKGVAFDVELAFGPLLEQGSQRMHVVGADVPRVGPRVYRDALGTRFKTQLRCTRHTGNAQMAGIAHQGHFVEVDGKSRFHAAIVPRFQAFGWAQQKTGLSRFFVSVGTRLTWHRR